jgi:hypothetical protein
MPSLETLAHEMPYQTTPRVPAWTLGAFRRASIAYANGAIDPLTRVIWTQSHGMTGDLRIPPHRPKITPSDRIADMDRATLVAQASAEGAVGDTFWNDGVMSWDWRCSHQPYDKWPEPAELRRVGVSMIEFAPSGAYVEDWRLLPSAAGAMAGLRLVAEMDTAGHFQPRTGGLVMAGDHAIMCLERQSPLPDGVRAQDYVAHADDPAAAYAHVAAGIASHFVRRGGAFTVDASTDPWAEGSPAHDLDGFTPAPDRGHLIQSVSRGGQPSQRLWRICSLAPSEAACATTAAADAAFAWIAREADTLLDPLPPTLKELPPCAS